MAITRKRPETIAHVLQLQAAGVPLDVNVVYANMRQSEVNALFGEESKEESDAKFTKMVQSWDLQNPETGEVFPLNEAGLTAAEDEYPGITVQVVMGFHDARAVTKRKN